MVASLIDTDRPSAANDAASPVDEDADADVNLSFPALPEIAAICHVDVV